MQSFSDIMTDYDAPNMFKAAPLGSREERSTFNTREIFRDISEKRVQETTIQDRMSESVVLNYYGGNREEANSFVNDLKLFLARRKV